MKMSKDLIGNDFEKQIVEIDSELTNFLNDMVSKVRKEAQNKASIDNKFKSQYVVGYFEKSKAEDFYAISDEEVILTPALPIPTPIEHNTEKDNRKRLDNLVSMLYKGLQILKNEEAVVNYSDGYKGLRYKCLPMVKHLSLILNYRPPHYQEVIEGEIFKILDFAESNIVERSNVVADMFAKKMEIDKHFSDNMDKHNKRMEAIEKVGKGDFVDLESEIGEKGLGWRTENGEFYKFDMSDEEEKEEDQKEEEPDEEEEEEEDQEDEELKAKLTTDFDKKVNELDVKYKVKF